MWLPAVAFGTMLSVSSWTRSDAARTGGTERLNTWLAKYLGAGEEDEEDAADREARRRYHRQVGRKFMISAVARIDQPGWAGAITWSGER